MTTVGQLMICAAFGAVFGLGVIVGSVAGLLRCGCEAAG